MSLIIEYLVIAAATAVIGLIGWAFYVDFGEYIDEEDHQGRRLYAQITLLSPLWPYLIYRFGRKILTKIIEDAR